MIGLHLPILSSGSTVCFGSYKPGEMYPMLIATMTVRISTVTASEHGWVDGQMARQVEWVGVRLVCLGGGAWRQMKVALCRLLNIVRALPGISPAGEQFVRARAECPHFLGGVVGGLEDAELFAIGIEFVNDFWRPTARTNNG